MIKRMICGAFLSFCAIPILSSCSNFSHDDDRKGVCRELESRIVFYGNTSNVRASEIQSAQRPLIQKSYDKNCN